MFLSTKVFGVFVGIFTLFWASFAQNPAPKSPEIPPKIANFKPLVGNLFVRKPPEVVSSTYYLPSGGWKGGKVTASGKEPQKGIIAVSRDLHGRGYTFGKRVLVHGKGVFVIDDLMGQKQKNRIDFFTRNYADAKKWGRQDVQISLLD